MINAFPDYEYIPRGDDNKPHNMFHGIDLGFGGLVIGKPGMYGPTITLDVSGMHPASIRALNAFGEYTDRFGEIVDLRLAIKHKDFDSAKTMLNGSIAKYLNDTKSAKALAGALKIVVNSVYGLTSAKFENPMRDPRNVNNIVALRGALFMAQLKEEVEAKGYNVIHIKTDSIKIENYDDEIIKYICDRGLEYGYSFEVEHKFEKICLVNNAVYIAKLALDDAEWLDECKKAKEEGKPEPTRWTATGAQFAVPYVFKTLFSKEPLIFKDFCETKSVTTSLYLDMNEGLPDIDIYEKELEVRRKKGLMYKNPQLQGTTDAELESLISSGHNYVFVGKVGQFCPIKPNCGGGELMRQTVDKKTGAIGYASATGAKDYRWLESEMVKSLGKEDDIDISYYNKLVDDAVAEISKYGDFEWFVSDDIDISDVPFDGGVIIKNK